MYEHFPSKGMSFKRLLSTCPSPAVVLLLVFNLVNSDDICFPVITVALLIKIFD